MRKPRFLAGLVVGLLLTTATLHSSDTSGQRPGLGRLAAALSSDPGDLELRQCPGPERATLDARTLIATMNRERLLLGIVPLRLNSRLSLAAADRIADMFHGRYFDHRSPDGIDPFSWADRRGYDYAEIGENLAVGYRTADGIVDGWMHSPAHRENLLKPAFDEIGVALAEGSPALPYTGPTVVVLCARRRS